VANLEIRQWPGVNLEIVRQLPGENFQVGLRREKKAANYRKKSNFIYH
jgi:hypothetical protein